ncbi:hypothetical protein GCM10009664_67030 [Kitasatospora gansuensis]
MGCGGPPGLVADSGAARCRSPASPGSGRRDSTPSELRAQLADCTRRCEASKRLRLWTVMMGRFNSNALHRKTHFSHPRTELSKRQCRSASNGIDSSPPWLHQKGEVIQEGDPRHVAEIRSIPRPPDGVEEVPAMLSRPPAAP